MLKFQHIEYLWLMLAIVPLLLLYLLYRLWQKRSISKFGDTSMVQQLMPMMATGKQTLKVVLSALIIIMLSIGMANPQLGSQYESVKRKGVEVIIALDVSRSMLARDITPNRLMKAKQFVSNLIEELKNDRIGLVVFAGNAYLQMPLTIDHTAGKMYLKSISTDLVPSQGTAIGEAIRMAMESFEGEGKKHKALVIITDGENHEGDAMEAVAEAEEQGIVVHTVGVGTPKGSPIPGNNQYGIGKNFKKDKDGNIVLSKLNEAMLQQIAAKGGGEYTRLTSGRESLRKIKGAINRMEAREYGEKSFTEFEDQFQYFLGAAFILMMINYLVTERKGNAFANAKTAEE